MKDQGTFRKISFMMVSENNINKNMTKANNWTIWQFSFWTDIADCLSLCLPLLAKISPGHGCCWPTMNPRIGWAVQDTLDLSLNQGKKRTHLSAAIRRAFKFRQPSLHCCDVTGCPNLAFEGCSPYIWSQIDTEKIENHNFQIHPDLPWGTTRLSPWPTFF